MSTLPCPAEDDEEKDLDVAYPEDKDDDDFRFQYLFRFVLVFCVSGSSLFTVWPLTGNSRSWCQQNWINTAPFLSVPYGLLGIHIVVGNNFSSDLGLLSIFFNVPYHSGGVRHRLGGVFNLLASSHICVCYYSSRYIIYYYYFFFYFKLLLLFCVPHVCGFPCQGEGQLHQGVQVTRGRSWVQSRNKACCWTSTSSSADTFI